MFRTAAVDRHGRNWQDHEKCYRPDRRNRKVHDEEIQGYQKRSR